MTKERRKEHRVSLERFGEEHRAVVVRHGGNDLNAVVVDLSGSGIAIRSDRHLAVGDGVELLGGNGPMSKLAGLSGKVARQDGKLFGVTLS